MILNKCNSMISIWCYNLVSWIFYYERIQYISILFNILKLINKSLIQYSWVVLPSVLKEKPKIFNRNEIKIVHTSMYDFELGQHSSLVAHWLLEAGDHFSNLSGGKKIPRLFWFVTSWLPFTFKLIHDNAKWSIHKLIHHVMLSIILS